MTSTVVLIIIVFNIIVKAKTSKKIINLSSIIISIYIEQSSQTEIKSSIFKIYRLEALGLTTKFIQS